MNPIPVVSAILTNERGEVLLQLRDDRPDLLFPGCWTLPGGMVEAGETPDEAIRREMWEEMELRAPLAYWRSHEAQRGRDNEITVLQHVYVGALNRAAEDIPLHEGQRLGFFGEEQIGGLEMAFDHAETLRAFFATNSGH